MDAIIFLGIYGLKPDKVDVQKACHDGNIKALIFFYDEYRLLPTENYSICNRKEKKVIRKDERNKELINRYTYTVTQSSDKAPKGSSGPPGQPESFTCHALPRKFNKNTNDGHFAFEIALINGDVKLLDWLYNQNLLPPRHLDIWSYPEESIRWLECINKRDQLGLTIVHEGPYA